MRVPPPAGPRTVEWMQMNIQVLLGASKRTTTSSPLQPCSRSSNISPMADRRARTREFALSLPNATEDFPWGERVAKVNGKVFVFLGPDPRSGPPLMTVKLFESHGHAVAIEGAQPT